MLQWTDPTPPTTGVCFYDHVIAKTPFGEIRITWKSWKERPSYDVEMPFDWSNDDRLLWADDLEEAKEMAQQAWEKLVTRAVLLSELEWRTDA